MSDTPRSCPFCGSYVALLDDGTHCGDSEGNWTAFRCLTSWHRGYPDLRKLQSKTCETVERQKLHERIKRLEDAGDELDKTAEPFVLDTIDEEIPMSDVGEQYEITYDSPPTAGDHVAMNRARKEWRKAKEAKL